MDTEPKRINQSLQERKLSFINSLRRRQSPDLALKQLMSEVNNFPPEAKDYLAFITSSFLEKDIYEKVMSKPGSDERMMANLMNKGLTLQQAHDTLGYFKKKHGNEVNQEPEANIDPSK